jgi:hypothetical protein
LPCEAISSLWFYSVLTVEANTALLGLEGRQLSGVDNVNAEHLARPSTWRAAQFLKGTRR